MRYASPDDFGMPEVRISDLPLLADRRLVGAPAASRRRAICSSTRCNTAIATGFCPRIFRFHTGELWGNFPQTYSMAGLILTAMRLSRSWEDRYWRG